MSTSTLITEKCQLKVTQHYSYLHAVLYKTVNNNVTCHWHVQQLQSINERIQCTGNLETASPRSNRRIKDCRWRIIQHCYAKIITTAPCFCRCTSKLTAVNSRRNRLTRSANFLAGNILPLLHMITKTMQRWNAELKWSYDYRSIMTFSTYASMNFVTRLSLTAALGLLPICHKKQRRQFH